MREIKFRCWLPELSKMETGFFGLRSDGKASFNTEAVLMQFLGLLDKNGKECYEGDVIKMASQRVGVIVFANGGFKYEIDGDVRPFYGAISRYCEIIGNIYENPNLLK